jgi:hypothetical protein
MSTINSWGTPTARSPNAGRHRGDRSRIPAFITVVLVLGAAGIGGLLAGAAATWMFGSTPHARRGV